MFIENLFCVIILAMTAFAVFYFFVNVVFDCDFGWYTIEKILYKMKKRLDKLPYLCYN